MLGECKAMTIFSIKNECTARTLGRGPNYSKMLSIVVDVHTQQNDKEKT